MFDSKGGGGSGTHKLVLAQLSPPVNDPPHSTATSSKLAGGTVALPPLAGHEPVTAGTVTRADNAALPAIGWQLLLLKA